MIIDTHCHYNLDPLKQDWREHWQKAQQHEVSKSIVIGTSYTTSRIAIEIASENEDWQVAVGIHPNSSYSSSEFEKLKTLLPNPNIVAIGETGLDYFRLDKNIDNSKIIDQQQQSLMAHIELADAHALPLVVHLRDVDETAYWDFLNLYKQHSQKKQPFILHCVSGPESFISQAISLGAYIGVAGNVTYKNSDHIRKIVQSVPQNRILLETDAPYLPPMPHRGHTCEPWMIQLTKDFLVDELSISEDTLIQNTLELFPQFSEAI